MAKIEIGKFGGILPSTDPRNLSLDNAQVAENISVRFGDFRPVNDHGASEGTANFTGAIQSLYRTPNGEWLASTSRVNYVPSPVNGTAAERTYLTGGAAYPRAYESGAYRQLGVPRPANAPALTVNVVDEFTNDELGSAMPGIVADIEAAFRDNLAANRIGSAPSPQTPPDLVGGDAFYSNVYLHMQMNGTVGSSALVDSSRFQRSLSTAGVTIQSPSGLTGGLQCGRFTGGRGITFPEIQLEADQNWQVDVWVNPSSGSPVLHVGMRNGYVTYVVGASTYSLFGMGANRPTNDVVRINSASAGANGIVNPGVWQKITLQNRANNDTRLFLRGNMVGSYAAQGIRLAAVGWVGSGSGFTGDMDEFRLTVDTVRTDQTSTTPVPFGVGYAAGGFWLEHGTATTPALPTSAVGDWAYLLPMVVQDGQYLIASESDRYLQNASFNGRRVTYSSTEWWAVPVSYQGVGYTFNEAACSTALRAILNPSDNTQLIPNNIADQIADEFSKKVLLTEEPVATYAASINTKQDTLDTLLSTVDLSPSKLTATLSAVSELNTAARAVTNYFGSLLAGLTTYSQTVFDTYIRPILPDAVDRIVDTRAYIYTYVTSWGEESQPSPASALVEADQNDTVTVVVAAPPAGRNVVGWRLYRSSTTNVGAAYQLIADKTDPGAVLDGLDFDYFTVSDLSYVDDQAQEELQENCQTATWVEPPANLTGLVGLPNGILAGFFDSTVCFSEPFAPYAWPVEYQITTKWPIVGMGVFGQTLVVLTEGRPYYISGADSASMSAQELEAPQSCVNYKSIVSMEGGVMFASPDGICVATPTGVEVLSTSAYSKADWTAIIGDATLHGGYSEGVYYIFYGVGGGSMDVLAFDLLGKVITSMVIPRTYTATFTALDTDLMYAYDSVDENVYPLFQGSALTGRWRSRVYVADNHPGFGWCRVNGPSLSTGVIVRIYGDGTLYYTTPSITTRDPVRLPVGRFREWQIEVQSTSRVVSVTLATDVKELL